MDDQQRQPRDGDRNPVRARIKQAVANGRISSADGDIRLTNVSSAQSMAELGLIVRDLDQLDAVIAPGAPAPGPMPTSYAPTTSSTVAREAVGGVRRTAPILIAILVLAVGVAGAIAFFVVGGTTSKSATGSHSDLPSALPITPIGPGSTDEPVVGVSEVPVAPGASYRLGADGIRAFLATYRARFSTSKVVDLTLYGDYVIVQVPIAGKARHSGWIYRDGGFSDFGGVTANFPGSEVIDTRKLDVDALIRNIAKARRSLHVEAYNQTYVTISYRPQFDESANVNIHVANEFNESGYLATTLDGSVGRAYPFES